MIQQMYETNLDHQDWDKAKSTCLICKIDDNITVNLEDKTIGEEGTHAEEFLLQELEKKSEVRNVTVFMNNSPCSTPNHTCADKLLKYLDANENVRMTMYVTRLYMIARESCKRDGHSEDITNGSVHSAGLQRLKQHARCEINAFNKNVWEELLNITKMTKEFKEEFMSKYCNVRSRKEEDDCIRSDLEIILTIKCLAFIFVCKHLLWFYKRIGVFDNFAVCILFQRAIVTEIHVFTIPNIVSVI